MGRRWLMVGVFVAAFACGPLAGRWAERNTTYDLVLAGGRVVDPASGLDAVRDVGISEGHVAAISTRRLAGREVLEVSGLVVAPGFVDLHAHGQEEASRWLQARDGVTTALDMEVGVWPVAPWYAAQEGRSPIHYGAAVGHIPARQKLKHDVDAGHPPTSSREMQAYFLKARAWAYEPASPDEIARLVGLLDAGLGDGAPGIGLGIQYTPGARHDEILRVFELAGRTHAPIFVHTRSIGMSEPGSSIEAVQEVLADATASGATLHIMHVTSSALRQTPVILDMIDGSRAHGVDVSTEAYPYTAASTTLASAFFDPGWEKRLGISYGDLQWSATGERLTRASFERYRKGPGNVIVHMIPEDVVETAIASPLVLIASDGMPFRTGGEHPRGAGTFARVLGRYVRERGTIGLMDAVRKMSLMPADRLAGYVPAMRRKGRLAVGSDADLTIFDAAQVVDRATYEKPMQPSEGIRHVVVGGTLVVRDGAPVSGALPGRPVRTAPPEPSA
jgi:dihydroorotase